MIRELNGETITEELAGKKAEPSPEQITQPESQQEKSDQTSTGQVGNSLASILVFLLLLLFL